MFIIAKAMDKTFLEIEKIYDAEQTAFLKMMVS